MEKHFLMSKTIWGAIIMGAHGVAMKFGYDIGDTQVWVDTAIQVVGLTFVIIGRLKAVKPISA